MIFVLLAVSAALPRLRHADRPLALNGSRIQADLQGNQSAAGKAETSAAVGEAELRRANASSVRLAPPRQANASAAAAAGELGRAGAASGSGALFWRKGLSALAGKRVVAAASPRRRSSSSSSSSSSSAASSSSSSSAASYPRRRSAGTSGAAAASYSRRRGTATGGAGTSGRRRLVVQHSPDDTFYGTHRRRYNQRRYNQRPGSECIYPGCLEEGDPNWGSHKCRWDGERKNCPPICAITGTDGPASCRMVVYAYLFLVVSILTLICCWCCHLQREWERTGDLYAGCPTCTDRE